MNLLFNLFFLFNVFFTPEKTTYDAIVVGGTPAGISAAIVLAKAGKTVLILEQSPVLGGLLSSGVSRLDDHLAEANSGIMDEFRRKVISYYQKNLTNDDLLVRFHKSLINPRWNIEEGRSFEPKVTASIYQQMVKSEPNIEIKFMEVPVGVIKKNNLVSGVVTRVRDFNGSLGKKTEYQGKFIIDATYEGDVAAMAGISFRIGRESRSAEEPHAGVIYTDAFCDAPTFLKGSILPGSTGEADSLSQAFTYRFVAKNYDSINHPYRIKKPPVGYDASKYAWHRTLTPTLPNNKHDMLGIAFGGDLSGYGTKYVLADWDGRKKYEEIYKNHALSWMYYIQTEGGQPELGLANDEFTDNNNFPYRLYVRQGRRINGLYTMTESDVHKYLRGNGSRGPLHKESVAIGLYPIDSHNVKDPTNRSNPCIGMGAHEGTLELKDVTGPYQIPYGVMVPEEKIEGIIVPVAVSSTHVAMSTIRMEPVWSSLGQAAGNAVAIALDKNIKLRDVPVDLIQHKLLSQKSTLIFYMDQGENAPEFEAVQKLSLKSALEGKDNYYFRPNNPITLGDFAKLVILGLDLPVSITSEHFEDLPFNHDAFRYIESIYDHSSQSNSSYFDYEPRDYISSWWGKGVSPGVPIYVYPDQPISVEKAKKILSGLLQKEIKIQGNNKDLLTRAKAAMLVYELGISK